MRYSKARSPWYAQPMIVAKAKSTMQMLTKLPPQSPNVVRKTASVRAVPVRGFPAVSVLPSTPDAAKASPVMVQTTAVSRNTPVMLIYPCLT